MCVCVCVCMRACVRMCTHVCHVYTMYMYVLAVVKTVPSHLLNHVNCVDDKQG